MSLVAQTCQVVSVPKPKPRTNAALFIAGLISVSDWLASNQDCFPCETEAGSSGSFDCAAYAAHSRQKARAALASCGWRTLPVHQDGAPFETLFPGRTPRPSQAAIEACIKDIREPAMIILEAPTGEGKTEAALQMADAPGASGGPARDLLRAADAGDQ